MSETSMHAFLNAIFGSYFEHESGYIELRQINENEKVRTVFCKSTDEAVEEIGQLNGNIYFGVAPRSQTSGRKESIDYITCLWVDIDYGNDGHKKKSFFKTKKEALSHINSQAQKPSIIVHSGNGLHLYWLLNSLLPVTDIQAIEAVLKGLIQQFKGDTGTHDISRILRVPGTINHKDASNLKKVEIIVIKKDLMYWINDFKETVPQYQNVALLNNEKLDIDSLPVSFDVKQLILNGKTNNDCHLSRSEADYKVVSELIMNKVSDNVIFSIFNQYPIGAKHRSQGPTYLKHTIEKARQWIVENYLNDDSKHITADGIIVNRRINAVAVSKDLLKRHRIIFSGNSFFIYKNGVYQSVEEEEIQKIVLEMLRTKLTKHKTNEILFFMKTESFVPTDQLNGGTILNLKNGLFDIETYKLEEHDPNKLSAIQLNVNYEPTAECPLWVESLNQIFGNNQEKIQLLQEFFGLSLTRETKYEKALFMIGDGANGKSVILFILSKLLGRENYSAIPLEKFSNHHYIANLFGKQVNISLETKVKSEVYDSIFKAVVSGDEIEADHKFKKPFKFRPFCKLIFALNDMPRVDDKTSAFFRRLLILRFGRKFTEEEQDKNLKFKLQTELNGIFNWSLDGLKRLRRRGYFYIGDTIQDEIVEYQKDNNNVLLFVDDCCFLDSNEQTEVKELYIKYKVWCEENGHCSLSKIRFGKQLLKSYPEIIRKSQAANSRKWLGIQCSYMR